MHACCQSACYIELVWKNSRGCSVLASIWRRYRTSISKWVLNKKQSKDCKTFNVSIEIWFNSNNIFPMRLEVFFSEKLAFEKRNLSLQKNYYLSINKLAHLHYEKKVLVFLHWLTELTIVLRSSWDFSFKTVSFHLWN